MIWSAFLLFLFVLLSSLEVPSPEGRGNFSGRIPPAQTPQGLGAALQLPERTRRVLYWEAEVGRLGPTLRAGPLITTFSLNFLKIDLGRFPLGIFGQIGIFLIKPKGLIRYIPLLKIIYLDTHISNLFFPLSSLFSPKKVISPLPQSAKAKIDVQSYQELRELLVLHA